MKLRLIAVLMLLGAAAFAQNTPTATFEGAGWNSISPGGSPTQPNPWCPQDSTGATATLTGFRLWDDGVKWSQVETSASTPSDNTGYTFNKFDWAMGSNVATKSGCNMHMLYQFGATPEFVALGTPTSGGGCSGPNGNPSACAPPKDLNGDGTGADAWWLNYVGQVALRYSGKSGSLGHMAYYGIWNEADSANFWCWSGTACGGGANPKNAPNVTSLNNLVLMAWDMMKMTRCIDSTSRVVSPDGHVGTMANWFTNYVNTTISAPARNITITPPAGSGYAPITCSWSAQTVHGYQTFDIVDEHMRGTSANNSDPTQVIAAYNVAATEMNVTDPVLSSYPLWNDEWGWNPISSGGVITGCQIPNTATGVAYIADNLALQASFNNPPISQEYFYQWDNSCVSVPSKTIVGLANDVMAGWINNGTVQNYTLAGAVYSIPLTLSAAQGGGSAKIMFDNSKTCTGATISTCATANQSAGAFTHYTDISGTAHTVSGGVVPVGLAPILLTGGSSAPQADAPTFSPTATDFGPVTPESIAISTTSGGAIICYTINGTTPATNGSTGCTTGTKYTSAVSISVNRTFNAVAGGTGFTDSTVSTSAYTFTGSAPTVSPFGGTKPGPLTVTITAHDAGTSICYTTDNTHPTSDGAGNCTNGTAYSTPFSVATSSTVQAIEIKSGWNDGSIAQDTYTLTYNLTANLVGTGSVVSSPSNVNCPGTCTGAFAQGSSVTLTATSGSGFTFTGWSGGGCGGTGTCVVTMNADTTVTATFTQQTNITTGILQGVMLQ